MSLTSDIIELIRNHDDSFYAFPVTNIKKPYYEIVSKYQQKVRNDIIYNENLNRHNENSNRSSPDCKNLLNHYKVLDRDNKICQIHIKMVETILFQNFWKTEVVPETLRIILEQKKDESESVKELMKKIKDIIEVSSYLHTYFNENKIKEDLLKDLISSILLYVYHSNELETQDIKSIVKDCALMIQFCGYNSDDNSPKRVFSAYLNEMINLRKSYIRCENCGEHLFEGLPYCFNCYERN